MKVLRCLLFLVALPAGAAGLSPEQSDRYHALIDQLRCLVCQNQSIAESNAGLAADLRAQVESQIAAGRTDAEIKEYLIARYGDFVLYQPPLRARTLLLWAGPGLLLLLGLAVAVGFARRSRRRAPVATADAAQVQRLLDEER